MATLPSGTLPGLPDPGSTSSPAASPTSATSSTSDTSVSTTPVTTSDTTTTTTSLPVTSSSSSITTSDTTTSSTTTSSTSSSTTTTSTTSAVVPTTTAPTPTPTPTPSVHLSTGAGGTVVTVTEITQSTQSAPRASASGAVRSTSTGFLQNKAAMGATFAIVGLVAAGILFALVTSVMRRRRARRFDREIAEEAKRAPAPVFIDDEDYPGDYHSDPYAGPTAYADHSDAYTGPTAYSSDHPAHTDGGYPASEGLSSGVHSNGVHSNGVHSNPGGGGTPSNYMYPSGYSDLGFSDVSSHGTYSQPPMEGQYNPGAYAAYGGVGAGVGAAGAYEMMGYHNAQQQQQQQQHGQEWHPGHQQQEWVAQGYVYPGEEHSAGTTTSYPPTATTTNSSGSDVLLRSKSGARSLVDAYAPGAAPPHAEVPQPKQYADGYVSQYQARMQDGGGAYGGLESMHGHVGGLEDEETDGEGDGRRVLKVANE